MKPSRAKRPPDTAAIAAEWDRIANERNQQLLDNLDLSMETVLVPAVLERARAATPTAIADLGCGLGVLTQQLLEIAPTTACDPSGRSIEFAKTRAPHASFFAVSAEELAATTTARFDLVVLNMVLMDCASPHAVLAAARTLLEPSGTIVATLTHPCFWPRYWGYDSAPWFRYEEEIAIESEFHISLAKSEFSTTHYHRPLSWYTSAIGDAGFELTALDEPLPTPSEMDRFPSRWDFPRFLLLEGRTRPAPDGTPT